MAGRLFDAGKLDEREDRSHTEPRRAPESAYQEDTRFSSQIACYQLRQHPLPSAVQFEEYEQQADTYSPNARAPSYNSSVHCRDDPLFTDSMDQQEASAGSHLLPVTPPPHCNTMRDYPSPRKVHRGNRFGSESEVGRVTTSLMNERFAQAARSSRVHLGQQIEFSGAASTIPDHTPTLSNMEMVHLLLKNEIQSRRRYANQTHQGENMNRSDYQHQMKDFGAQASANNQRSTSIDTKLHETPGYSFQPDPTVPVQHPSTTSGSSSIYQNDRSNDDPLTGLADLVLVSEPFGRPTTRTNNRPIQPPSRVAGSIYKLDPTSIPSPSKRIHVGSTNQPELTGCVNSQHSLDNVTNDIYMNRAQQVEKSLATVIPQGVRHVAIAIQAEIDQMAQHREPGYLGQFRPSNSALKTVGLLEDSEIHVPPETYGSSSNYRGDIIIQNNRSANIADDQNCAVWVLGLPGSTTHTDLLSSIRNVGQIYACVINPPTGQHRTSAAKIVFFERNQAEIFMKFVVDGKFIVRDRQIRHVRWNKIKSARYPHSTNSRSIRLVGPCHLMDFGFFEVFFSQRFTYELEARRQIPCGDPGMVAHEWHFGSLRCQAASAKTAIERELRDIFSVEWAPDPCM